MGLAMLTVYGLVALVWRSAVHRRREGDSGSRLAATTALGKLAAALMSVAHVVVLLGVIVDGSTPSALVGVGSVVVFVGALGLIASAQAAMGSSWRMGVDPDERTALVTGGVFAVVRNPIFTGMALCLAAVAAASTSWIAALGVALFVVGVEVQVRLVEEPYLRRVHGESFADYVRTAGRFTPLRSG